ncbi:MAG: hypothetical protein J5647_09980 [Spirochaetaceae bacterium]|nr:hypothetical protein [Spirochaetaceae bacterium]
MSLTPLQSQIQATLKSIGERTRFSEAILAKKIREQCKIEGKKKAGIALLDLEKAASFLEETENIHFSFMLNSANDLLVEKTETSRLLEGEARQRRLKSEKSMSLFTNSDLDADSGKKSDRQDMRSNHTNRTSRNARPARTERKSLNINSNFEDWE